MIAPTSGSSRASSSACEISTIVCGRNALRTSGRSIVIFAIPSPAGLVADVLELGRRLSTWRPITLVGRCRSTPGCRAPRRAPRPGRARGARGRADLRASCSSARRGSTPRPAAGSRSRCRPGLDFAVALHACLLARRGVPVDPRLGERRAGRAAGVRGRRRRRAAADAAAPRRRVAPRDDDTALVVHTSGTTAAPRPVELTLRQRPGQRARLGRGARPRPRRALAVPAAALARRRADGPAALARSTARRAVLDARRARRAHDDVTVVSLVPTQLAAAARRRRAPGARLRVVLLGGAAATPDAARARRARPAGPSRADLRAHPGLLAGRRSTAAPLSCTGA